MIFKRGIKALIALVLLALLLRGVDWEQAQQMLSRVSLLALSAALIAMIWELVLSAWKWTWTLRMHGLDYRPGYLFHTLIKGYFINNFLPTAVGGDAYRAYRTMPSDGFKSRAVSAVLLDRVSGLAALLFLGAVAACVLWAESPVARWYLSVCAAGGLVALLGVLVVYKGWLKVLSNRVRHLGAFIALEHNLGHLQRARKEWIYVVVLSLAFQATSIGILYWLFGRIDYPVSIAACALMTAAAGVAAVLPVSINGIGVMEGSLVGMAVALGVEYDSALVVAILRRLLMVTLSMLCGTMFLIDREPSNGAPASAAS
jgi:uncharacterized protein (TIRG00374 family)